MVSLTRCRAAHACAAIRATLQMLRIIRRSLAGHSKWANIRHKKGGKDAAKADQFQKLAKVIETSSKLAGGDRSHPALASALSRAKDARMQKKRSTPPCPGVEPTRLRAVAWKSSSTRAPCQEV